MGEHCSLNNNNSQSEANPESGVTPILRNSPRASIFVSGLDAIIEDGERASLKALLKEDLPELPFQVSFTAIKGIIEGHFWERNILRPSFS